jgi:hypothetical protein
MLLLQEFCESNFNSLWEDVLWTEKSRICCRARCWTRKTPSRIRFCGGQQTKVIHSSYSCVQFFLCYTTNGISCKFWRNTGSVGYDFVDTLCFLCKCRERGARALEERLSASFKAAAEDSPVKETLTRSRSAKGDLESSIESDERAD